MSKRKDYNTLRSLTAVAANGGNNQGIYVVQSKISGNKYIEKRIKPSHVKNGAALREIRAMLQCISHPHIVFIKTWDLDYSYCGYGSIFMQRCELGSLDLLIARYDRRGLRLPDEGFLWKVFWDVALAVCYLYTGVDVVTTRKAAMKREVVSKQAGWNRLLHRDIKPANVFLTWKDEMKVDKCPYPTVVLGDLGGSVSDVDAQAGRVDFKFNSGATPVFDPPEAPGYNTRVDTYMLGLVVHCLARMKSEPVPSRTEREEQPLRGLFRDASLNVLVMKCLKRDPYKRPTPAELPMLVWEGYEAWRRGRRDDGQKLPSWAFG